MLNISFIKKYISSEIGGGRGYSVLVNYQSLLSNFFSLASVITFLSKKYRQNKLLLESFIELPVHDFMIIF